jgi:hypothetical protein
MLEDSHVFRPDETHGPGNRKNTLQSTSEAPMHKFMAQSDMLYQICQHLPHIPEKILQ